MSRMTRYASDSHTAAPSRKHRLHYCRVSSNSHFIPSQSTPISSSLLAPTARSVQEYWQYSYPLRVRNTVPSWAVPVISTMVPAAAFAVHNFVTKPTRLEAHNTLLACWSAVFATALATNLIKLGVSGRCCTLPALRPGMALIAWTSGLYFQGSAAAPLS